MPPSDNATQNTPLAPSVEKAYYRKCIELKRRLNEVEAANDEAKLRRVRLDRAIMKMRLERAFLLEQLGKRMEQNADGSEGSGDEGLATPPPDRPHRDKRRKQTAPTTSTNTSTQNAPPPATSNSSQPPPPSTSNPPRTSSLQQTPAPLIVPNGPNGSLVPANAMTEAGEHLYLPPHELQAAQARQRQSGAAGGGYPIPLAGREGSYGGDGREEDRGEGLRNGEGRVGGEGRASVPAEAEEGPGFTAVNS